MAIKRERGFFGEGCAADQIIITKKIDKVETNLLEEDKFTQIINETRGEFIPDWDWPDGGMDNFFDKFDKKPTISELNK